MFEKIKCFILDMDGTIYLGNELFPFTKDFLKKVEETGREYYFFTNNSSKSQRLILRNLGSLGYQSRKIR
jgi:4-nitrophenyl phosphatase